MRVHAGTAQCTHAGPALTSRSHTAVLHRESKSITRSFHLEMLTLHPLGIPQVQPTLPVPGLCSLSPCLALPWAGRCWAGCSAPRLLLLLQPSPQPCPCSVPVPRPPNWLQGFCQPGPWVCYSPWLVPVPWSPQALAPAHSDGNGGTVGGCLVAYSIEPGNGLYWKGP